MIAAGEKSGENEDSKRWILNSIRAIKIFIAPLSYNVLVIYLERASQGKTRNIER